MRDDEFALRHALPEKTCDIVDILDARADEKALAAAIALAQQRLAHGEFVEGADEGAHREPVHRWRGDDGEIAHAGQGKLQGARNGGGGERQHMDFGAQLLQALLVADAEVLLLVDDDQAEVFERDGLAQNRMGADDDIHFAGGELGLGHLHRGGGHHA